MVRNKGTVIVEAAEVHVSVRDCITPSKLYQLADEGWIIVDAWKLKDGGFNLLVTRKNVMKSIVSERDVHLGTPGCPNNCNCVVV